MSRSTASSLSRARCPQLPRGPAPVSRIGLIETFCLVLLDDLLQCFNRHRQRGCIHHCLSKTWKAIERRPGLWCPQVRTDNAFRAVKECFFDLENQCEVRCLAASRHRLTEILSNHSCPLHPVGHKADGRGSQIARASPAFCLSSAAESLADAPTGTRLRVGDDVLAAPARLAAGRRVGSDPRRAPRLARA
jgi:hypothetical protein